MSIIGTIHEDVTTDVLGNIGSWQWLVTFVSGVLMVPSIFNQYEDIFLIVPSEAICTPEQGYEVMNNNSCYVVSKPNNSEVVMCDKWQVKLLWLIWLKKSWQVFCDHDLKLITMAIICRFGLVFGCIIFGLIADSIGRKIAITIDLFASLTLGLVITFCDSEAWFGLLLFLKSLLGSANIYIGLLIVSEISSNSWRTKLSTIVVIPRLVALVCMVPLANTSPNLETYSLIACLVDMMCILSLRWCPESPQWLIYNRKINKAEQLLKNAAKMNGIMLCQDFKIRPVNHRAYNCLDETCTCVTVVTTYNVRTIVLISLTFWMLYNFFWSTMFIKVYREEKMRDLLIEVLCFIILFGCLSYAASKKLQTKQLLLIYLIITGTTNAFFIIVSNQGILRGIASSIAISTGVIVHAILLNITPRFFGINIRATIFGCCCATGQLGTIVSYLVYLFRPMNDVIYVVVELCAIAILALMCVILPNVDGRELPDIIEDMDYYSELTKPLRWATQKTNSASNEEIEMRIYSFGSGIKPVTSLSEGRPPAKKIGCIRLLRTLLNYLRCKRFKE